MSEKKVIPQINEIKRKNQQGGVNLSIKSCYPEGSSIAEQIMKVDEEIDELNRCGPDEHLEIAREALDVATACVGLAEKQIKKRGDNVNPQIVLQFMLDRKYEKKQKEFSEEG